MVLAFIIFYIPAFLGRTTPARVARCRPTWWPRSTVAGSPSRDFQRRLPGQIQAYRGSLRRQPERADAEAARHRPADPPADDRRAGLARRGRTPGDQGRPTTRWRSASCRYPAFQENGQFIGDERYSAAAADAASADDAPTSSSAGCAAAIIVEKLRAALTDWITVADKDVEQEFQRRNEKVKLEVVSFPADKFRAEVTVTDAELAAVLRRQQGEVPPRREAQDPLRARGRRGAARHDDGRPNARSRARTTTTSSCTRRPSRCAPATSSSRPRARTTPTVKAKAEEHPEAGEVGSRLRGARQEVLRGRGVGEERAATSTTSPAAGWSPSSTRSPSSCSRARSATWSRAQFGLPHHQGHRQEAGRTCARSTKCVPQIEDQLSWEKAQSKAADMATAMEAEIKKPADLDKAGPSRGLQGAGVGLLPARGADPRARAVAAGRGRGLHHEAGRGERRHPRVAAATRSSPSSARSLPACRRWTR